MPWNEVKPMDEKVLFVADCIRGVRSIAQTCRMYGISRKTGYKWLARYRNDGPDALKDRTSRPHNNPAKTPYIICKEIIELRKGKSFKPGPGKILSMLAVRHPAWQLPSRTTVHNILCREGLVEKRKRSRRVTPSSLPFLKVEQANDVWSADFKGQFTMGNGRWCYPLTVMDHESRYLLGCKGLWGTGTNKTKAEFDALFREYGLPLRIRTDNGVPFASQGVAGLSRLSVWWIRLGIVPERIEPGKPQQNGRHERMHKTLKAATTRPAARSMSAQQAKFNRFIQEYNEERPHEGIGQQLPASKYQASERSMPRRLPEVEYEGHYRLKKVTKSGLIYLNNTQVYIGNLLGGECVGLQEVDDGAWEAYFGQVRLGAFDERDAARSDYGYIHLRKV